MEGEKGGGREGGRIEVKEGGSEEDRGREEVKGGGREGGIGGIGREGGIGGREGGRNRG